MSALDRTRVARVVLTPLVGCVTFTSIEESTSQRALLVTARAELVRVPVRATACRVRLASICPLHFCRLLVTASIARAVLIAARVRIALQTRAAAPVTARAERALPLERASATPVHLENISTVRASYLQPVTATIATVRVPRAVALDRRPVRRVPLESISVQASALSALLHLTAVVVSFVMEERAQVTACRRARLLVLVQLGPDASAQLTPSQWALIHTAVV